MTTVKWLVLIVVLGYCGLLGMMYIFQRALLYFPDSRRTPPAAAGLPRADEVVLTSVDGEKLIAWHVPPRGSRPVVIYFHGNAGALDLRAGRFKWLTEDGVGLVALSYRGYGGSSGKPSETGLIDDGFAAYDFAAARYPANHIVFWGESLGTGVAIAVAAERKVAGVILDAPFTSIADVGAAAYPFAPVRWLIKDPFRSDERIARVSAPLLALHGELDRIVPIRFGEKLFSLAREPKRMVRFPQGGHVNLDDYGAEKVVKTFLNELSQPNN
jgi:uncharacterized protein